MTDFDDEDDGLFISYTVKTKIVRVIDTTLIPSRLTIKAEMFPGDAASQDDLHEAIAKIEVFFDTIVRQAIAFSSDNTAAFKMFIDEQGKNRTNNILMITPFGPSDELLAAVFQSKMQALADGAAYFPSVEVRSDGPVGLAYTFVGEGAEILPTIGEWIGDRSYFAEPWWCRDDATTLDVIPPPDADLTAKPTWALTLDDLSGKATPPSVVRPNFKPTVIDGGKDA
jgi:hypothetical protein